MGCFKITLYLPAHFYTGHLGHHDIAQYNIGLYFFCFIQSFFTILRFANGIYFGEQTNQ